MHHMKIMKNTEVQTLGELRMSGIANGGLGYWRSLPLVASGESDTG